jgi:hypothetical protein
MKSVTRSDIVQTVTYTFRIVDEEDEMHKVHEQNNLLGFKIDDSKTQRGDDGNMTVVASRVVPPEEYQGIFSNDGEKDDN